MSELTSRDLARGSALPEHEAVRLLQVATGRTRSDVLLGFTVEPTQHARFVELERRRSAGEPLQYLEGSVPFGSVEIVVDERVLIPRPETEQLLEMVPSLVETVDVVVDLCTGSGNLAIALARSFPAAQVYATDISADALAVAQVNARANDVAVTFCHGDLFSPLPAEIRGAVGLVVANPPYLADHEYDALPSDVKREPRGALVAGRAGDEVLARIASEAGEWLTAGGVVACEISEFHGRRIEELFAAFQGRVLKDLSGKDRFVVGARRVE